jgi:hypothetical protein
MNIKDILITGQKFDINEHLLKARVKRHKYGVAAREDRTTQGIVFASKREMEAFLRLQTAERAGIIRHLKRQVPFTWDVVYRANGKEYVKKEKYIADFTYMEGRDFRVADAKGCRTQIYNRKKRIMKELFGIEIVEI